MIQVLHRALGIVELVSSEPAGYTVIRLAAELGLNRATCSNIVHTLVARGYLIKMRDHRNFMLGPRAYGLSRHRYFMNDVVELARPDIDELSRRQRHPSVLAAVCQARCYVVYAAKSDLGMPRDEEALLVEDVSNKATGRVLLAHLTDVERQEFLVENPLTAQNLSRRGADEALLRGIRDRGHAEVVDDERLTGLAVPLFSGAEVVAALGMYMDRQDCPPPKRRKYLAAMKAQASRISRIFTVNHVKKH